MLNMQTHLHMHLPTPYTLVVPSIYGQVLVNRFDTNQANALIKTGASLDAAEIAALQAIIQQLPAGQVFLDVGANFGLYGLAMAHTLKASGGTVLAFEAQRILFNMVCGSVALNSIENMHVHHLAIADQEGWLPIPKFDYNQVSSYGSVEFGAQQTEPIGQVRGLSSESVRAITLDSLQLQRVDMVKIDIEGMEEHALAGAVALFDQHRPIAFVEWVKSNKHAIVDYFAQRNYSVYEAGMNLLCMPKGKGIDIPIHAPTTLVA
jgi:FkbM family methyltransferase